MVLYCGQGNSKHYKTFKVKYGYEIDNQGNVASIIDGQNGSVPINDGFWLISCIVLSTHCVFEGGYHLFIHLKWNWWPQNNSSKSSQSVSKHIRIHK